MTSPNGLPNGALLLDEDPPGMVRRDDPGGVMGNAFGELLPLAVGVAVSPIPVIAVILMLFTDRARTNSLSFLLGWVVGIAAAATLFVVIAGTQDLSAGGAPSTTSLWIKLILGVLVLLIAIRQWRARPTPGQDAEMPGWMQKVDALKPGAAVGLGFLLSAINPKNLLLIVGAAVVIAQANLGGGEEAILIAIFTVIGACTVAVPTLAYLFAGSRIQPTLDAAKEWLAANNATVMAVLLLVIGVSLLGKGLGGLL